MHSRLAAYAKSPAQAQMHVIHTCLLIHNAQKSLDCSPGAFVYGSFLLVIDAATPDPQTVNEGEWRGGALDGLWALTL